MTKQELLNKFKDNADNPLFMGFVSSLFERWEKLQAETNTIAYLIKIICKHYGITEKQLIDDKEYYEARGFLFYVLCKKMDMSYATVSELFLKTKNFIYRSVGEAEFLISKAGKKNLIELLKTIDGRISFPKKSKITLKRVGSGKK